MPVPDELYIYHIVHLDRLPSIISDNGLLCDAEIAKRPPDGAVIGMNKIKDRRLKLPLNSHPDLYVGDCVPFYFCPRSVMLYVIYKANHAELSYHGGQGAIVHLEASLRQAVVWLNQKKRRWAFTTTNAGSRFFEDYSDITLLDKIDWRAVQALNWMDCKERKQAEFLVEHSFPWELITRIGVHSQQVYNHTITALADPVRGPVVEVRPEWYY